jgi:hypothetical protein
MRSTNRGKPVAVVGATGHTGRFVLDELERRGSRAILIGRDAHKLAAISHVHYASETRVARLDDPASLDDALAGAAAVINCAGPFVDTALPVVDAALRAKIPYLDVTAEQAAVKLLDTRDAQARKANVVVLPASAFYGGLADLLAASIVDESRTVDEIMVAVALDSWHPTQGTRITGQRNTARRLIVRDGTLKPVQDPPPRGSWTFPAPFGDQDVAMLPFSETITLSRHFNAASIESWINVTALRDIRDTTTPPPEPSDERRRSSQMFVMDVLVRSGERRSRATAYGQDIYAVSAPIIVEALQRILTGEAAGIAGVRSLGEVVDASAFLETLVRGDSLRVQYETGAHALLERME